MSQILSQINGLYSCRERQISQLYHCLCGLNQTLIVYGLRSTAKTSVVKTLCQKSNSFYAYINTNEFFSNKMVFENILNQLNDKINCFQSKPIHCNSLSDFIDHFKQLLDKFVDNYNQNKRQLSKTMAFSQCIVVLDSIDSNHHLIDTNNNELITTLTNLQELTQNVCPITCVFISRQSIEWFCRITSSPITAIQIHFTNYSPQEMSTILVTDCPKGYDKRFYQNFVEIIVKTLIQITCDLSEIRNKCLSKFAKYVEPITSEEMSASDTAKLYKRFQPILMQIMNEIPLKEVNKSVSTHEWPQSMKYLLIACYLSSYNSVKNDKKLFVKYEGKRKVVKERIGKEDKECIGPKGSTLERVLQIYRSIIELNAENSDQYLKEASNRLLSELEELVSMKLVNKSHSNNKYNILSSLTKYQISNCVTEPFVHNLAQELNFNIKAFIK